MKPYNVKYAYTLFEILHFGLDDINYVYDYPGAKSNPAVVIKRNVFAPYNMRVPTTSEIPEDYVDKDNFSLIELVLERYWNEYVFESDERMEDGLEIEKYPDILKKTRLFISRFLNILVFTWKKYTTILSAYETNKNKLMDKLQKVIDGEINNTGYQTHEVTNSGEETRKDNDTPQDIGDFSDDDHTSFITHGETSSRGLQTRRDGLKMENDVTESWDDTSIIERIEKIEYKYQQTMKKWTDEFAVLFVDGGNYHEI